MFLCSDIRLIAGAFGLVLIAAISHTALGQETADLTVTAQIQAACTLNGGAMDFGNYSAAAASEGSATFSYTCTNGTDIVLSLGQGQQPDGENRGMSNGNGGLLTYQLYQDPGRTIVWGADAAAKTVEVTSAAEQLVEVYGLIDAGQGSPAGIYNDTVTITLLIQ